MRLLLGVWFALFAWTAHAQTLEADASEVLSDSEWETVSASVDQALEWLITQQNPNGSFPTQQTGQPGVTGLCLMAFLAQGHIPDEGRYGTELKQALDYIVSCQKRNGLLASVAPNELRMRRDVDHRFGYTVPYNHAIAGLVLSESYAMVGTDTTETIEPVIEKALQASFEMQDWPKGRSEDQGGWRYLDKWEHIDSDLSITGWQLMFLRSAKNAGFEVEEERIHRSIGYVRRCFLKGEGTFTYKSGHRDRYTRGMAGAGILALAHSGMHNTPEAQNAGAWLLKAGFERYNAAGRLVGRHRQDDRYFYGLLTSSQAMYQLGDRYWREFFPPMAKVLINGQNPNGSWDGERHQSDGQFGNAYTTAIGVLALSASNQLLPIFQR